MGYFNDNNGGPGRPAKGILYTNDKNNAYLDEDKQVELNAYNKDMEFVKSKGYKPYDTMYGKGYVVPINETNFNSDYVSIQPSGKVWFDTNKNNVIYFNKPKGPIVKKINTEFIDTFKRPINDKFNNGTTYRVAKNNLGGHSNSYFYYKRNPQGKYYEDKTPVHNFVDMSYDDYHKWGEENNAHTNYLNNINVRGLQNGGISLQYDPFRDHYDRETDNNEKSVDTIGYYSDQELGDINLSDKDIDVVKLQKTLKSMGYNLSGSIKSDGNFDGILGKETTDALLDYKSKLSIDKSNSNSNIGIGLFNQGGLFIK